MEPLRCHKTIAAIAEAKGGDPKAAISQEQGLQASPPGLGLSEV